MVTVSALAATLFLGGWRAPWPISIWDGANTGWWPLLWFFVKVVVALFVFIWLRGTLPRLRYDQFMHFGWKVLVPTALVWILVVATMRTVAREADLSTGEVALFVGVPVALLVLGGLLLASRSATATPGSWRPTPRPARSTPIDPEPEVLPPAGAARRPTGGPEPGRGRVPDPADGPRRSRRRPGCAASPSPATAARSSATGRRGTATTVEEEDSRCLTTA